MHKGRLSPLAALSAALLLTGVLGARNNDTVTITRVDTFRLTVRDTVIRVDTIRFGENRIFNQVERPGNPLVAEVFLEKRDHDFHDAGVPSTDRANFQTKVERFITTVAGRRQATATAIATALLPDMLTLQTDKVATTAGYLRNVLNPNTDYGGRRPADDAVDISLSVVFGPVLDTQNVSPGLVTDNVPAFGGGPAPIATFPYLAPPNAP